MQSYSQPKRLVRIGDRLWIGGPVKSEGGRTTFWSKPELDVRSITTIIAITSASFNISDDYLDCYDYFVVALTADGLLPNEVPRMVSKLNELNLDIADGRRDGGNVLITCDSDSMEKSCLAMGYFLVTKCDVSPVAALAALDSLSDPAPARPVFDEKGEVISTPASATVPMTSLAVPTPSTGSSAASTQPMAAQAEPETPKTERFVVLKNNSFREIIKNAKPIKDS